MKRIFIPVFLLVAVFAFSYLANSMSAQAAKKTDEKKSEAKEGDAKKAAKPEKPKYPKPENYEKLMKKLRLYNGQLKRSVPNRDQIKVKGLADKLSHYVDLILEMDTDKKAKRYEKEDYKKWSKEMTDAAKALLDEVSKDKPDWAETEKKYKAVGVACETCHKKYKPEDD